MGTDSTRTIFGMAYSNQFGNFYPRIFQELQSKSDIVVVDAIGRMDFDSITSSYRVGSKERLNNGLIDDNLVEFGNQQMYFKIRWYFEFGLDNNIF